MQDPLLELGKLVPKETISKLYDDAVSGPATQVGKLGTDAIKVARLLLAPLQGAAAFQDRLERLIERIRAKVPEDKRIEIAPELSGPILEKMRFVVEDGELSKMFEEILTKGIDRDRIDIVHPCFGYIIAQLSRDEAWLLYLLRDKNFESIDTMDYDKVANRFSNRVLESSTLPSNELHSPNKISLYYSHLESLGLLTWPIERQEPIIKDGIQVGTRRYSTLRLTEFGQLFVKAAIPAEGFGLAGTS